MRRRKRRASPNIHGSIRACSPRRSRSSKLQYREQRIHAVGHGAAANWDVGGRPRGAGLVRLHARGGSADDDREHTGGDNAVLRLSRLADAPMAGEPEQVVGADAPMAEELERFVDGYADWIAGQQRAASELGNRNERAAADRICGRMSVAARSDAGDASRCFAPTGSRPESFRLANRAMLDQMVQADRAGGREAEPGKWRPFQLAFLSPVMVSAIREEDDFRDVLDLIWFPTGGGKTEALPGPDRIP